MIKISILGRLAIIILFFSFFLPNGTFADILTPDRLPPPGTWESAGVEGGIRNRTTICATVTQAPFNADSTGATSASKAIQQAINSCPVESVVYVPPGTYKIDAALQISKGITLRGAGATTIFYTLSSHAVNIGQLAPWPPPKANATYYMDLTAPANRGQTSVSVANTSQIPVGKMVMIDEEDDPALVYAKVGTKARFRASMHMVESKTATSVVFRPPLPIAYSRNPRLSRHPDLVEFAGVEKIKFTTSGITLANYIHIISAWNSWVTNCEFSGMSAKTIVIAWSGHVEIRKNYLHDQASGGPNSEGIDLFSDVNWSLVVDNIAVAAGFPQIVIGDAGSNPYDSGGFGNVIAYNYCVNSYYTDPPTSTNHWMMAFDISTNHSPHTQYNLVEGNVIGKFGSDGYHGSGSHTVLLRNLITASNDWKYATHRTAIQIDRRNLYYSVIGNVLGRLGTTPTYEYVTIPVWSSTSSAIFRLGYPDAGNQIFLGTYPPTAIAAGDGGVRDLYVDRAGSGVGTTLIEGNWNSFLNRQDWTVAPQVIPASYFLASKPSWFGSLPWPPVDPSHPKTDDVTIIPAGYRYVHGVDPPASIDKTTPDSPKQLMRVEP